MCAACEWENTLQDVERRLVDGRYAFYAAELATLAMYLEKRQHAGSAIQIRLEELKKEIELPHGEV